MGKTELVDKECAYCHKKYQIKSNARKRLKYCSAECHILAQKERRYSVVCPICQKTFTTTKALNAKYCSIKCYAEGQRTNEHQALYKQTLLERYGVERTIDIPGCREKKEQTTLKHFGVKCSLQNSEVWEKGRKKCKEVYGDEYPQRTKEVKEKIKETCRKRYGADSVLVSKEFLDKQKKLLLEKYGVSSYSQLKMPERTRQIILNKEAFRDYIESQPNKEASVLYTDLAIDDTTFYDYIDKYDFRHLITHSISKYEQEIKNLFPTVTFIKDRTILDGKEIDLYSPQHKIGIEFNGNYWHSDLKKDKNYHLKKSMLAQEKGVLLFHIFEYEWVNERTRKAIINRLNTLFGLNTAHVYARNCRIVTVQAKIASNFYNENHVQGRCSAQVHIGLQYNNEIIALMSFKTNGINKRVEWELCRFACKAGYVVPGGASKLFKYFIENYDPSSVVSYSDIAKTTGNLYKILNFTEESKSHPQYVWVRNGINALTRYKTQLKQLIKLGWKKEDDGLTEDQIMYGRGYHKLYDCGKCVWVWKRQ